MWGLYRMRCQVCGQQIMVDVRKRIHTHGFGWSESSMGEGVRSDRRHCCFGTGHLPYEMSRDALPKYIALQEARLADLNARLAALSSDGRAYRESIIKRDIAEMQENIRRAQERFEKWKPTARTVRVVRAK